MFGFLAATPTGCRRFIPRHSLRNLATPPIFAVIAAVLQWFLPATVSAASADRPNIVLIMADDMGYSDIGCYGGEIDTPNLNGLAANGLRFTQFYNTSRCCPTRASLMTGVYPHQAGVGHMMNDRGYDGYRGDLNKQTVTIAEVLGTAGYRTYMAGKWHVTKYTANDGPKFNWPQQRGFEKFYGTIHGAGSYYDPNTLVRGNEWVSPYNDPKYKPERFYYTNAIADNAVMFLDEHAQESPDKPFFMYVAFTAAHWPMHAFEEDIAKYKGKYDGGYPSIRKSRYERMKKMGLIDQDWDLSPQAWEWGRVKETAWEIRCMEVYAAMVDCMDRGVGRIVGALQRHKQFDNTLIFFLQDNGGCAESLGRTARNNLTERPPKPTLPPMKNSDFQVDMIPQQTRDGYPTVLGPGVMPGPDGTYIAYGEGWANTSNTPFRMYKHYVHEGGISTPLIAHWPAKITRHGEYERTPGHLIDIMATCVDVSEAKYPKTFHGETIKPMEGKSLLAAFAGETIDRDAIYWEHEGNRAVRVGDWKLVARGARGAWELYDMAADRSEMHDLAAKHPGKVQELGAKWRAWAERANVFPLNPQAAVKYSKKKRFALKQGADLERSRAPYIENKSFSVTCDVKLTGANGVIAAQGGTAEGWSLYLKDGVLCFVVRSGRKLSRLEAKQVVVPPESTIAATFERDGRVRLAVDGKPVMEGKFPGPIEKMPQDGLQIGWDKKAAVGNYDVPFRLEGTVEKAVVVIKE